MTAHPTLQHDDVSGHLLVLSMAKLWKGGAAAAAALCRHLSLFGMCTVVRGDRLHGLVTDHRGLSREHGQDDAKACRRRRRRRIVQATCSQPRTDSGSRLPSAAEASASQPISSMHILARVQITQMAVFCAVNANNCSRGTPIGFPTSTSTHPRLLRARGRCLGPSKRPYAPQTRLLEQ